MNLLAQDGLRFDTSQVGGTFYDTYENAKTYIGDEQVDSAALVLDSGWQNLPNGDQVLAARTTATVNDNTSVWNSGGSGFTTTCDLPPATIQVGTSDPVTDGATNEEAVQGSLADSGNAFRVVDCKYQYVLSIPSLDGSGTYYVEIWIDGQPVPTPDSPLGNVKFNLK